MINKTNHNDHDQINFDEVKEIVEALNFRQLELAASQVQENDKTEDDDEQGVTEEPVIATAVVNINIHHSRNGNRLCILRLKNKERR